MEQYLIPAGLILNSLLIVVNRFWRELPDWLYLPGLILGISMIIVGGFMRR